MENQTKGQIGAWRRLTGVWVGLLTGVSLFLDGFTFYEVSDYRLIWAGGVISAIMLIAGIAKDVVQLAKEKL